MNCVSMEELSYSDHLHREAFTTSMAFKDIDRLCAVSMNGKEQKDTSTCLEKDHGTSLEKDHGDLSI